MTGRCIAIGDIHGCAVALETIIRAIAPQKEDLIVILGDVIDRGPNSRKAVELLLELQRHCTLKCVMGNHEEMFLGVMRGKTSPQRWIQFGGASMLDSYGFVGDLSVIPPEHVEFIESFVDYVEADKKRSGGKLRWVLVAETGVDVRDDVPSAVVRNAVAAALMGSVQRP